MFDSILGLPIHPLVVHAVVVLGPLTALIAIAYAVLPRSRKALRWPLLLGALVTAGTAFVAQESGEALFVRVAGSSTGQNAERMAQIADHQSAGERLFYASLVFAAIVLLAAFLKHRPKTPKAAKAQADSSDGEPGTDVMAGSPGQSSVATVMSVLLVLAAIGLLVTAGLAGHSGATAVWGDLIP